LDVLDHSSRAEIFPHFIQALHVCRGGNAAPANLRGAMWVGFSSRIRSSEKRRPGVRPAFGKAAYLNDS
jgi:hypothetical protein